MAGRFIDKETGADSTTAIADDATGRLKVRNLPDAAGFVYDKVANTFKFNGNDAVKTLVTADAAQNISSEVVVTTKTITALESGKTFYLSLAAGFTVTLPAPAAGLRYKFIVKTAPTGASYIITTNAGANLLFGMFYERAGGAGLAGAAQDTQNFVVNQSIIADWAEYSSDGTNWYINGGVNVIAGVTFAVT